MAFIPPQRNDVPHPYGSDAVTKQLILPHISNTNDRKRYSMQVMLIKENGVHTPSEDPHSQPTYYASLYQQAISGCLRIANISITNIQAREKKETIAERHDGDGMWPTASHRRANHKHRRPPTSVQEQLRAVG